MPCLLGILLVLLQGNPSSGVLVQGVDKKLRTIRDLSAEFEVSSSNQPHPDRGLLKLKRDGGSRKMRLEYLTGEQKLFVANGKTVTEYIPSLKYAEQKPLKESDNDLIPLMLLLGREGLFEDYPISATLIDKPVISPVNSVIELTPRNPKDRPLIILEADPKTFLVHRLKMTHSDGYWVEFRLKDLNVTARLESSEFEFKPPPGVELRRR
jgi:outer membrane lipoprotein-sorting protein